MGLFIKQSNSFKIREGLRVFIPHVYESLFIEVENESQENIIVGVVYRPSIPQCADLSSSTLFDIMEIINSKCKVSSRLGDANI